MNFFPNICAIFLLAAACLLLVTDSYAEVKPPGGDSAPTSSRDVFPALPASEPCTQDKIIGLWKLLIVYDVPSWREIEY